MPRFQYNLRTLRTDKVSGALTCGFGVATIAFSLFGLLGVAGLHLAFSARFTAPTKAALNLLMLHLPFLMIGGLVFAVAGFYVVRGSQLARRIAQFNAICGYLWLFAYVYSCYHVIFRLGPSTTVIRPTAIIIFDWFSLIGGTLLGAAFPTTLLLILSSGRRENY